MLSDPQKKLVSIIIVNWRSRDFLCALLDSLVAQSYRPLEIIVINNSPEETLPELKSEGISYQTIAYPNIGYAAGNNRGIAQARGEYILLLNPDTRVEATTIATLVSCLDTHQEADAALPKLMQMQHPDVFDRAWDGYSRWGWGLTIGLRERDEGQYDQEQDVFGFRGAGCLFRNSFFSEVGLFDEDLFAYYEDVDLSARAQLAGKHLRFCPTARVLHHFSGSTGSVYNSVTVRYSVRNKILVYFKTMPGWLVVAYLWRLTALLGYTFFQHAFTTHQLRAYMRGFWEACVMLPRFLGKRKHIRQSQVVSSAAYARMLKQAEAQYWISRKRVKTQNSRI